MAKERDDELRDLRARAYGRDADIHLDAVALGRLRELERAERPAPVEHDSVAAAETAAPDDDSVALEAEAQHPAHGRSSAMSRSRRSALLLVLGVAVVAMIIAVSPTLLERVQTDPLQEGAVQIARLRLDPGFTVPSVFFPGGSDPVKENGIQGFEAFHGLRVVKANDASSVSEPPGSCLIVYLEASITDPQSNSFSGPSFYGCSVGAFPAATQFRVATQGLPAELAAAFPTYPALQFIYDSTHDEVVVFADTGTGG